MGKQRRSNKHISAGENQLWGLVIISALTALAFSSQFCRSEIQHHATRFSSQGLTKPKPRCQQVCIPLLEILEKLASELLQVVGKIQFLAAVELRSFSCGPFHPLPASASQTFLGLGITLAFLSLKEPV